MVNPPGIVLISPYTKNTLISRPRQQVPHGQVDWNKNKGGNNKTRLDASRGFQKR